MAGHSRHVSREEIDDLYSRSLAIMYNAAVLGGYTQESEVETGHRYDVPWLEDRLLLVKFRPPTVILELPYSQVEGVEIGGPGIIKTGGGFIGGGFGAAGAAEGMAIAAVLNGLTSRRSKKTIIRIQGTGYELFLLDTMVTPERLRIELSRPLATIRAARAVDLAATQSARATSPVEDLAKLADMLDKGLLTREEFDVMKVKLLGL
jgi:hypothetical protein